MQVCAVSKRHVQTINRVDWGDEHQTYGAIDTDIVLRIGDIAAHEISLTVAQKIVLLIKVSGMNTPYFIVTDADILYIKLISTINDDVMTKLRELAKGAKLTEGSKLFFMQTLSIDIQSNIPTCFSAIHDSSSQLMTYKLPSKDTASESASGFARSSTDGASNAPDHVPDIQSNIPSGFCAVHKSSSQLMKYQLPSKATASESQSGFARSSTDGARNAPNHVPDIKRGESRVEDLLQKLIKRDAERDAKMEEMSELQQKMYEMLVSQQGNTSTATASTTSPSRLKQMIAAISPAKLFISGANFTRTTFSIISLRLIFLTKSLIKEIEEKMSCLKGTPQHEIIPPDVS